MAQFVYYKEFKFNNIDSEKYQLYIVSTDKIDTYRQIGVKSKLDIDENYSRPLFKAKTKERNSFDIELTRLDEDNNPLSMSEEYIDLILEWLEKDEPKCLEVGGILYYGCFTDYKIWYNCYGQGIMKFTFEMSDYYCYSSIIRNMYNLANKDYLVVELMNKSNIKKIAPIDIKLIATGDCTFKISNQRNKKSYYQKDVKKGEQIQIYGESHEVVCLNDLNKNVFKNKDGDWLFLEYGINKLRLEGVGYVLIEYQTPLGLR